MFLLIQIQSKQIAIFSSFKKKQEGKFSFLYFSLNSRKNNKKNTNKKREKKLANSHKCFLLHFFSQFSSLKEEKLGIIF